MGFWNPWHGCTRFSEGCAHCYVFALDEMRGNETRIHKNETSFHMPVAKNRAGAYKYAPGTVFATCFTSDIFLEEADPWRAEVWRMMRERSDCTFEFFTKRILRARDCLPPDWGEGYPNARVYVSIENQRRADERVPALLDFPARWRGLAASPLLDEIHIEKYLETGKIHCVSAGGEAYNGARVCKYDWVLALRQQCRASRVCFTFHQTGEQFYKDGRLYRIPSHRPQCAQARKANIDYSPQSARNEYEAWPEKSE